MNESFWFPVQLSILVASIATGLVFVIGIVFARWFTLKSFKGKLLWETLFLLPLVLPPSVIGFLLIIVFGANSWIGRTYEAIFDSSIVFTPVAAVLAALVVAYPLMFQSAKAGFLSIDRDIEGAARVDGASEWRVLVSVVIPLAKRSLLVGAVLSFTRALGEFGATLMFAGNIPERTQTIPTAIYIALESGDTGLAFAYVFISVASAFVLLTIVQLGNKRHA
ncbi:molybdate ABC transporter permease subunit [Shouchella shacheensis]|uniref:molybdate ABC transporter permease subunit n=1 Tax=Shouchella shacheensis TaxID=1649580 RepID=UPI00073FB54B|nr:molybdate ABC transporter permease subunit [Shouchella shacheensis]